MKAEYISLVYCTLHFSKSGGHENSFVHPSVTKTLTWLISSEVLMIEHWYLACMILLTSPFYWYHAFTLTFDLFQGQICWWMRDHNFSHLLVNLIFDLGKGPSCFKYRRPESLYCLHLEKQLIEITLVGYAISIGHTFWWFDFSIKATASKIYIPPIFVAIFLSTEGKIIQNMMNLLFDKRMTYCIIFETAVFVNFEQIWCCLWQMPQPNRSLLITRFPSTHCSRFTSIT